MQPKTQGEMWNWVSFGNTIEYVTLLCKEEEGIKNDIILVMDR